MLAGRNCSSNFWSRLVRLRWLQPSRTVNSSGLRSTGSYRTLTVYGVSESCLLQDSSNGGRRFHSTLSSVEKLQSDPRGLSHYRVALCHGRTASPVHVSTSGNECLDTPIVLGCRLNSGAAERPA